MIFPFSVKWALLMLIIHYVLTAKSSFNGFKNGGFTPIIAFSIIFYVIYLLSLAFSDNLKHGLHDVETKAGFFIFPVLAWLFPRNSSQQLIYLRFYIVSFFVASIICSVRAAGYFITTADSSHLFYDQFSFLMHPTYFTMYAGLALLFHLYSGLSGIDETYRKSAFLYNFTTVILFSSVFLTSSRAGIVILVLCLIVLFSGWLFKLTDGWRKDLSLTVILSILLFALMLSCNTRFVIIFNELTGAGPEQVAADQTKVDENPVAHRFILMQVAANVALNYPFGVGAGDVQDVLVSEYQKIGYEKAVLVRYNPHNQFLQTAVATGWPGLGLLILIFSFLIFSVRSQKFGHLLFFLGLILALNGMFESVFEVQRGVLLYAVMLSFLHKVENSKKFLNPSN